MASGRLLALSFLLLLQLVPVITFEAIVTDEEASQQVLEVQITNAEEEDLEAWRLIEVDEGRRIWMKRKEMLHNLTGRAGVRAHFFDVTDLPTLNAESAPTAPPIPNRPPHQVTESTFLIKRSNNISYVGGSRW